MKASYIEKILITRIGDGERKVAFSGDSLLFQYGPRVQQLFEEGSLSASVAFVVAGSCPPVPGIIHPEARTHCSNLPPVLLDLVKREKIQSVVLGASWAGYGGDGTLVERAGNRVPLIGDDARGLLFANLEDFVTVLQNHGAKVHLVLGAPVHGGRFDPGKMVTRSPFGYNISPDVAKGVPVAELRAPYSLADAKLRAISERTGAILLDPVPDVCGDGENCLPFFGSSEPKYSDGTHLRPMFVRENIRFFDFVLK